MTKLSVNINKVATIRNARGGNVPDVIQVAIDCERYGAHGITVHPRPDQRHIRYDDVYELKKVVTTELNIEGFPDEKFIDLVLNVKPNQVTLVPDPPGVLTSNAGWNTLKEHHFLKKVIDEFKAHKIRTSIFVDTESINIENAIKTGTDRIEFYTGPYAEKYIQNREAAIKPFVEAAGLAKKYGLGINAGHDLSLENLLYFHSNIPNLLEVSIGHALISDALYFGLENTIKKYLICLK
ncbi:MAG: pyridoxine 5'-phosphate synthase [Flavobacteriales bacterium]|nr:pyridoxine 5'-phosphate synthase [Flavobacteriales bacterium]